MRLSEWRAGAPHRDAAGTKVSAVVDPILEALGSGPDPHAWVVWGEDASNRYTILVPTDSGLIVAFVRPFVPGEGPRASAKLVRWGKVAVGELGVEAQAGHRLLSFQVEQQVLRGVDADADRVAAFALRVIAAVDGRPLPAAEETPRRRARATTAASAKGRNGGKASRSNTPVAPTKGSRARAASPSSAKPSSAAKLSSAATGRPAEPVVTPPRGRSRNAPASSR
jgi:hypothetical protein